MINAQATQNWFAAANCQMRRPVMAHEDKVLLEIHGIELGVGATRPQHIHDLHRHGILEIAFARGAKRGASILGVVVAMVFLLIGDVFFTIGAGDVDRLGPLLRETLEARR